MGPVAPLALLGAKKVWESLGSNCTRCTGSESGWPGAVLGTRHTGGAGALSGHLKIPSQMAVDSWPIPALPRGLSPLEALRSKTVLYVVSKGSSENK